MIIFSRKWILILSVSLVVIGIVLFLILSAKKDKEDVEPIPTEEEVVKTFETTKTIGLSVEGRKIEAYTFGTGPTEIAFVGGVHGGYEWNSIILAYKFIDYFTANPSVIPKNLSVTIIPSLNPDGAYKVIGKEGRFVATDIPKNADTTVGRFNANNVDLNRNFDCEWQPKSTWRNKEVSAGGSAFSEPEAKVLRDFVLNHSFKSVTFWHSQSGNVYASDCENGILPETLNIMNVYAKASGYGAIKKFDAYKVTGDAEGWLAKVNIPAITVELTTHETLEWEKNLAGVKALLSYYNK